MSLSSTAKSLGLPDNGDPFAFGGIKKVPRRLIDALYVGNPDAYDIIYGIDPVLIIPVLSNILSLMHLTEYGHDDDDDDGVDKNRVGKGRTTTDSKKNKRQKKMKRSNNSVDNDAEDKGPYHILLLVYKYLRDLTQWRLSPNGLGLNSITSFVNVQAEAETEAEAGRSGGNTWSVSVGFASVSGVAGAVRDNEGRPKMEVRGFISSKTRKLKIYRMIEDDNSIIPSLLKTIRSLDMKPGKDNGDGNENENEHHAVVVVVGYALSITSSFTHRTDISTTFVEIVTKITGMTGYSRLLDTPVNKENEEEEFRRSLFISFLIGVLCIPNDDNNSSVIQTAIPWKEWQSRVVKVRSEPYTLEDPDIPDKMGLLKQVLSVGLLSQTKEDINDETVQIVTDLESFAGHYWGEKSAQSYSPRCQVMDVWGRDIRCVLNGLITVHRSRMELSQKKIMMHRLQMENTAIVTGESTSLGGLSLVTQAFKTFLFQRPPVDTNARYHPFGAIQECNAQLLSEEQLRFLWKLSKLDGLMSLRSIDYTLHGYGFPAAAAAAAALCGTNGLHVWLLKLPSRYNYIQQD